MGSANIRPSLHPEQKNKRHLRPSQDFRFEHSFTVHVVCPCRRRRRDSSALEAVAGVTVVVVVAVVRSDRKRFRYNGSSDYFYCYFLILCQHPRMRGGIARGDLAG